jgi:hypothetical protein
MKQLFTLFIAVAAASSVNATVITSVANGNATNPLTWSCTCIPMDGDTIVINHAIVLDVDYAYTMGGITINPSGSVTGNAANRIFGVTGGYFINNGTVSIAYLAHTAGTFTNNGAINVLGSLLIDQSATLETNGPLTVGDTVYVNTNATLENNGSFNTTELLSDGTITNTGNLTAFNLFTGGTLTHSGTSALILQENFYNIGNAALNAYTEVLGGVYNAENLVLNGYLKTESLFNGDSVSGTATIQNNGTVSVTNSLYNTESINGNGSFCIADSSVNAGAISGTLDICDQTGGGWDINVGTQTATVTHCANGPCTIGVAEQSPAVMTMVPNPAHELVKIQLTDATAGVVEVIDVTGRVVLREDIAGKEAVLNVLQLPEGIYSVVVRGDTMLYSGTFIKE